MDNPTEKEYLPIGLCDHCSALVYPGTDHIPQEDGCSHLSCELRVVVKKCKLLLQSVIKLQQRLKKRTVISLAVGMFIGATIGFSGGLALLWIFA